MMTLPTKRTVNFTPSGSYSYQNKWGGSGSGIAQFANANGIALDDAGNLYVADKTNQRIQKFSHSGTYLTQWGSPGAGDGQFSDVVAVAVDPSGYVYACDWYNNRVQKFSSDGVFVSQWGSPGGIADGGDGHFDTPNYIAADRLGDIYVTESEWGANKRVQKFTGAGTYITKWSGAENGIAVDRWGNVFVTAYSAGVVKKFDSNGNFITQWAGMNGPDGIATDSSGYVYVSINRDSVVKKYTSTGTLVATIGTPGSGDGQLSGPAGLAVDAQGNLFVCDAGNSRIQVFR
jgi:sugar lactone lactonase YvrE